jgi:tetratricopeptide (TPR) repeat protein
MFKNPNDRIVHKWIGDLLYEGRSYNDALRAYEEIDDPPIFEVELMKCKCFFRVADLQKVGAMLAKITKLEKCRESRVQVDVLAVGLLRELTKPQENPKEIASRIKKLNSLLEGNNVGYIFSLIDCMYLLGIATLDSGRYEEAYQSFLLTLELYNTLIEKHKS